MIRHMLCIALSLGAAIHGHAQSVWPAPIDPDAVLALRERIVVGSRAYSDNDLGAAAKAFDAAIASPLFETLDDDVRYAALSRAGSVAVDQKDYRKAHALLVRATAFENVDGFVWHARLQAAYALDDYPDSALCLSVIAESAPATVQQVRERAIIDIYWQLVRSGAHEAIRFRLLAALFDAGWESGQFELSLMWLHYVQLLLERDDMPRAVDAAARISDADTVVLMRADRRFDKLVAARKGAFEIARMLDRQCDSARSQADRQADALQPRLKVMRCLLRTRKHEETIAYADGIIETVARQGMKAYVDSGTTFNWILDARSRALIRLERWDDAVAQLRKASRLPESGGINVSQTLNLARLYADLGRVDEARESLELVGSMSGYGRMQMQYIGLLGALDRGDEAKIAEYAADLSAHRDDAIDTYRAALLQMGRDDEVAKFVIDRLRDPQTRGDMLLEMQEYEDVSMTPRDRIEAERWRAVVRRPDVMAAVERVGRVERIPFARSN